MNPREKTAGSKLIDGAKEALAIAKGEQPAAAIWHNGHQYVPATEIASLRRELEELREDKRIVDEMLDAAIIDYNEARAKALEEAAQIADSRDTARDFALDDLSDLSASTAARSIAAAIRNLAGEKADG